MALTDLFGDHSRHFAHTHRLDPDQFKELLAMATANTAALTSIAASIATVAAAAVTAIDNPTGDTAATVSAVDAAVTSLTATETALKNALNPSAPTDTFTFSPASLPTPVAGTDYSQPVSASSTAGAAAMTAPGTKQDGTPNVLPAGLTFDGATVTWPAASVVSGPYGFELLATDSTGATATQVTSWTVL